MASVSSFMKKRPAAGGPQATGSKAQPNAAPASPAPAVPATTGIDQRSENLLFAVVPCRTRGEYVKEIKRHWDRSRKSFLAIGRYLNIAKGGLPHGEFEAMIENDMPFSVETAFRFRALATAVDSGRVSLEDLPEAESVAYQLVTLKEAEFEAAKAQGLVRKDVRRQEIIDFKRTLRAPKAPPSDARRKRALLSEYASLKAEAQRIARRMAEVRDELLREHGIVDPDNPTGGMTIDVEAERIA